jgi:hypothetical protein
MSCPNPFQEVNTMNGFLVIARCGMDDLPMRLCATRDEASKFARAVGPGDVREAAEAVNRVSVSEGSCIGMNVLEFLDGEPQPMAAVANMHW